MNRRQFAGGLAVVVGALGLSGCGGTEVNNAAPPRPDEARLAVMSANMDEADTVDALTTLGDVAVRVRATNKTRVVYEAELPLTYRTMEVVERVYGDTPAVIEVAFTEGRYAPGGGEVREILLPDAPPVAAGQDYLMVLRRSPTGPGVFVPAGGLDAQYALSADDVLLSGATGLPADKKAAVDREHTVGGAEKALLGNKYSDAVAMLKEKAAAK